VLPATSSCRSLASLGPKILQYFFALSRKHHLAAILYGNPGHTIHLHAQHDGLVYFDMYSTGKSLQAFVVRCNTRARTPT
jgi:hypothetical protein